MRPVRVLACLSVYILAACSSSPTAPTPPPVVVNQPPAVVVTPPVVVSPPPVTNPLLSDPRFDRRFYEQFTSAPLRRWAQAPRIYLRTVDNGGKAVSAALLDQTAAALINTTGQWTGGAFGVAGLERGTGTMRGQSGWITVEWDNTPSFCGTVVMTAVTFGSEIYTNVIVMNHVEPICTCGPLVMKHELGHALGYNHTDSPADIMSGAPLDGRVCDRPLSDREAFHARVAYSLSAGSMTP